MKCLLKTINCILKKFLTLPLEYILGGFTLISIIFHVIYAIVKHFRQTLKPEKN